MATTTTLYGGAVQMSYDPLAHAYVVDGRPVASVTKIVGVINKPLLIPWAVKCTVEFLGEVWKPGTAYSEGQIKAILDDSKGARYRSSGEALNVGRDAHDWLERYVKSKVLHYPAPKLPTYPPTLAAVQSYLEWEKAHEVAYESSERKVYSREFHYTGTADSVMRVDGRRVVADFKTSKGIYPEYLLQAAAYAHAVVEEDGGTIDDVLLIRVPKDGEAVEVAYGSERGYTYEELFDVFVACLLLHRWLESVEKNGG